MKLQDLGTSNYTDKSFLHHFCDFYENELKKPDDVNELWEIGVDKAGSLNMWAEYYTYARIVGFDIVNINESLVKVKDRTVIKHLDQSSVSELNALDPSNVDILVDDGSHMVSHQIKTFEILFSKMKPGSQYVLEDLHTSSNAYGNAYEYRNNKGALQYLETYLQGDIPSGFPGQTLEAKNILPMIDSIKIVSNRKTNSRKGSITAIITKD